MRCTILDCYTDEPAGLGVPPYLGTYPRYIAGRLLLENHKVNYLTIDDLRAIKIVRKGPKHKTDIRTYNKTNKDTADILNKTDVLIVICGIHVPGKYLSALPGTLFEVTGLVRDIKCRKVLTGPAATEFGTRMEGGKRAEKPLFDVFDEIIESYIYDYDEIAECAIKGAEIVKQIPYTTIAEIETARGCAKSIPCSFCTEPLKSQLEFRKIKHIVNEVRVLRQHGICHFRLGKQSDFFSWKPSELDEMLRSIHSIKGIKTLHIDNIDPVHVTEEKIRLVVKYCTEGNVAALGIETFDKEVIRANNLNSNPEMSMKAIRLINKFGAKKGPNGMPYFLPGINILFGLKNESKKTHQSNMEYLHRILDERLLVRRINIRQVAIFPGTQLYKDCREKFIRKNKKYYWKWRNEIRQKIDNPMLMKLVPVGSVLKNVRMEIYDGNTTFGRQIGTYPLVVGVRQRLELGEFYNVRIIDHMLRSVVAEIK